MAIEVSKEIRRVVDTGKVAFGTKACKKSLARGEGEMIIISANMPKNDKETLKHLATVEGKKVLEIEETGHVLGSICGKPFVISAMIVLDKGKSNILEAVPEKLGE